MEIIMVAVVLVKLWELLRQYLIIALYMEMYLEEVSQQVYPK